MQTGRQEINYTSGAGESLLARAAFVSAAQTKPSAPVPSCEIGKEPSSHCLERQTSRSLNSQRPQGEPPLPLYPSTRLKATPAKLRKEESEATSVLNKRRNIASGRSSATGKELHYKRLNTAGHN